MQKLGCVEEERGDSRGEEAPISKPSLGLESSEMDDYSTFLCPPSVRLLLARGERDPPIHKPVCAPLQASALSGGAAAAANAGRRGWPRAWPGRLAMQF